MFWKWSNVTKKNAINSAILRTWISVQVICMYNSTVSPLLKDLTLINPCYLVFYYFRVYAILKIERNICRASYFFKCKHFSFVNSIP